MDRLGIGGNAPPISERLEIEYLSLAKIVTDTADELAVPAGAAITTPEDAAAWSEQASTVKGVLRQVEAARKGEKDPITKAGKDVEAFFAKLAAPLEALSTALVGGINRYQQAQLAEQRRKQAEAAERERKVAAALEEPAPTPPAPVAPRDAGRVAAFGAVKASASVKWKGEVIDATQLPRQYLMPNQAAIDAAVNGGAREIPGVRIHETVRTAIR